MVFINSQVHFDTTIGLNINVDILLQDVFNKVFKYKDNPPLEPGTVNDFDSLNDT